jgi:predicted acylesterase/phospholipase RssA
MNHRSHLLLCLFTAALFAQATPARAAIDETKIPGAMAISGGASKGAYEAGLTWAVNLIVRASTETPDLSLGGRFRAIEIAGIAGTSAGGINALLAGVSWCVRPESQGGFANRIDDNIFRNTWLAPNIDNLLPPEPGSPPYLPDDAALSRQSFLAVVADLREKSDSPGTFRSGCRVPMGVTVTRTTPERIVIDDVVLTNQRFYIPFELVAQPDGSAEYRFDPSQYPDLNDPAMVLMPRPAGAPDYSVSFDQVEDAVFATSAFPTGFGRKRLRYCRLAGLSPPLSSAATPAEREALARSGLACPAGYELAEGEFADGGLFDNLPLGLARILAEERAAAAAEHLPTTYFYLDPNRLRFEVPEPADKPACQGENPPEACRTLEYGIASEATVIGGFLGTARKYELYRELTSERWRLSLRTLGNALAKLVDAKSGGIDCQAALPYFDGRLDCAHAIRRAGGLLEASYDNVLTPIVPPVSANRLQSAGIASECRPAPAGARDQYSASCRIDFARLRRKLADAYLKIATAAGPEARNLVVRLQLSAQAIDNDRTINVTSVGAPITGALLGAFGAFLDRKFLEYDYYVGVYDGVAYVVRTQCGWRFSRDEQRTQYLGCFDRLAQQVYKVLGVREDPKARYVFALLARQELGAEGGVRFAYSPMPPEDRDMRIIHDGLNKVLLAGNIDVEQESDAVFVERTFFDYLRDAGFEPTPPPGGGEALLAQIIADPENWSYELTKRWTTRLVYLEQQAHEVFEAREPDPEKREKSYTTALGLGAWGLQSATYKYPGFAFAPSTAPKPWLWRNVIPYEVAIDLVEGDLLALWQPTWNIKGRTNIGIRFGFGFAGGIIKSQAAKDRDNYGTAGLDFTFLSKSPYISSYGFTPAVYHTWKQPDDLEQTTAGLDVHVGFLKNRLRVGIGVRDVDNANDTTFLTVGIADLPGAIYWLSR